LKVHSCNNEKNKWKQSTIDNDNTWMKRRQVYDCNVYSHCYRKRFRSMTWNMIDWFDYSFIDSTTYHSTTQHTTQFIVDRMNKPTPVHYHHYHLQYHHLDMKNKNIMTNPPVVPTRRFIIMINMPSRHPPSTHTHHYVCIEGTMSSSWGYWDDAVIPISIHFRHAIACSIDHVTKESM